MRRIVHAASVEVVGAGSRTASAALVARVHQALAEALADVTSPGPADVADPASVAGTPDDSGSPDTAGAAGGSGAAATRAGPSTR